MTEGKPRTAEDRLREISRQHPGLMFQNKGYEYIPRETMSEDDQMAYDEVTELLRALVPGFSKFNNFKVDEKDGRVKVRCQIAWDRHFVGVCYLDLAEFKRYGWGGNQVTHGNKEPLDGTEH